MIKFSHSLFALPFAGIAFIEAIQRARPGLYDMVILSIQITVCMVTLRSAAMGFNRITDRRYDALNPRTSSREIPAGVISEKNVALFVIISLIVFFVTAFTINLTAGLLSPVAAVLVLGYSYTKRFTLFSHYILGFAIGIAPVATWIAVVGKIDDPLPLLWSAGLGLYIAGFDILYSCQDAEFDREAGLHSIPSRLGILPALWIARFTHVIAAGLFFYAGHESASGLFYYITICIVSVLFIMEHAMVRPGRLTLIPIAFFHINAAISLIIFTGLLLDRMFG